jgi:hypothetical protein
MVSTNCFNALAKAIMDKRSKGAIAKLIETYADEFPVASKRRFQSLLWSHVFTLVVIAAIGVLGWLKIINGETTGTLLGGVVGAIYGRASGVSRKGTLFETWRGAEGAPCDAPCSIEHGVLCAPSFFSSFQTRL